MLSGIGPRRGTGRVTASRRASICRGSEGTFRTATKSPWSIAWRSTRGRCCEGADLHRDRMRNIASGRTATTASTRPTGRCSPSCFDRASIARCPISSATRSSRPSPATIPDYSSAFADNPNCLTWVILKGHTNNTAGEVTLRSPDPRDPPAVHLPLFRGRQRQRRRRSDVGRRRHPLHPQDDRGAEARGPRRAGGVARRAGPVDPRTCGSSFATHAWGHHASCTCPIGERGTAASLTPALKVHGTTGLRVVDASVFPRIPGLFIASAVYMVGEKAAELITADSSG